MLKQLQLRILVFANQGLQGPWYCQDPEGTNGLSCLPRPCHGPRASPGLSTLAPEMPQRGWSQAPQSPAQPWAPTSWVHVLAWPLSVPTLMDLLNA